ncbi:transposase (plasmid) [Paracoccus yeei]|uniref:Transposase n=1 Tax=Paracoccus yeei TaxID=147645 RepID=A0A5P2QLD4_9RHOB|nr:transposase [Paracoccus yeei]
MNQSNTRYFWLSAEQMRRMQPFFPKMRGRPRSNDCKVLSGIIYVKRNRLRWQDAPAVYDPYKTLYNRFARSFNWSTPIPPYCLRQR